MKKRKLTAAILLNLAAATFFANCYLWLTENPKRLFFIIPLFLAFNLGAGTVLFRIHSYRLRVCTHGAVMLSVFLVTIPYPTIPLRSIPCTRYFWQKQ